VNQGASEEGQADVDRPARVVIADPAAEIRRGIREVLQDRGGFTVVASTGDGTEALELIRYYKPDIAVIELEMSKLGGVELIKLLVADAPEVRVLVFSTRDDDDSQLEAFRAGASGFVSKRIPASGVANAAKGMLRGEAAVSRALSMALVERLRALPESGTGLRPVRSPLTSREWEVADLMAGGLDTREIAADLVLSEETVYTHIKNILRKLDVHSRREAIEVINRMRDPGSSPAS
jgi:NarL family two-component system response regulator LiaR